MMRSNEVIKIAYISLLALLCAGPAIAQDMRYEPVNPSFGGDSFNSSHLLAIANGQNDYKDPAQKSSESTQTDLFLRQLQSRLLSSLAGQVTDAIFGDNPQESGTIVFGAQTIEFSRGIESVTLIIRDSDTGGVTQIEIPIFTDGATSAATTFGSLLSSPAAISPDSLSDAALGNLLSGSLSGLQSGDGL
jgi:curli production assembly/transport component CsgF